MYGINDVFDYESDLRNPRKGGVEGAVLDPRYHRPILIAVVAVNVPFLVALVLLGGPASWLVLAISVFAVVAYSAPGLRFKERPVLDSITSSTHFVSPAVYARRPRRARARCPHRAAARRVLLLGDGEPRVRGRAGHPRRPGGGHRIRRDGLRGPRHRGPRVRPLRRRGRARPRSPAGRPRSPRSSSLPYLAMCAPFLRIDDAHAEEANRGWRRFLAINYGAGFLVTLLAIGGVALS